MLRDLVVGALVGAGVAVQLLVCLGVVLMRDALARLHYTGASTLGVACLCAAVVVSESASLIGLKAILTAAFMLVTGPVVVHATARAIHLHREAQR
jgi:monovalent cation/proton antiporter MnhG/PhaG subunit